MLGLNKQPDGTSCFAYALYNLGAVNADAVAQYVDDGKEWNSLPQMLQEIMFMAGQIKRDTLPGSGEYVKQWLGKWAPELVEPFHEGFAHAPSYYRAQKAITIPEHGRGVVLIVFDGPVSDGHALAYENGFYSDSGDPDSMKLETWADLVASYQAIGFGTAKPVHFVSIPEEQSHALAHA